jgi:hypothetical protein
MGSSNRAGVMDIRRFQGNRSQHWDMALHAAIPFRSSATRREGRSQQSADSNAHGRPRGGDGGDTGGYRCVYQADQEEVYRALARQRKPQMTRYFATQTLPHHKLNSDSEDYN